LAPIGETGFEIRRSLPHGHVLAALATARRIGLDDLLPRRAPQRRRDLALALIVARLLDPAAKLATARILDSETASHSLGETIGLGHVTAREIYTTLDWLGSEQTFIENQLARRHLKNGALVLYDVTSTYLEGRCCPLARHGYSRDSRGDRPQLVIGLLCAADGCPVAVEVFEGNTADPATVAAQITRLKQRFRLRHVVLVGDRAMLTSARIAVDGSAPVPALRRERAQRRRPFIGMGNLHCRTHLVPPNRRIDTPQSENRTSRPLGIRGESEAGAAGIRPCGRISPRSVRKQTPQMRRNFRLFSHTASRSA
jgi:hypothetical protein